MNLSPLQVTKQQASSAVLNYRRALHLKHNEEYEQILRGYNAVLKGRKLIELSKVIAAGGLDQEYRPRLAIMRADQRECWLSRRDDGSASFHATRFWSGRAKSLNIAFPPGTLPTGGKYVANVHAIVPLIPPQHMPAGKLERYHILWEAEWSAVPPRDPALLQHLGGDLWAVLSVWDLTDLEMAVLAGRRG